MKILASFLLLAGFTCGAAFYAAAVPQAEQNAVDPNSLLPGESVIFLQFDGTDAHMPAIRETAKWKALDDSGLRERVFDVVEMFAATGGSDAAAMARRLLDTVFSKGVSAGVALTGDEPGISPYAVIVIHGAGSMKQDLISLLFQLDPAFRRRIETRTKSGRHISVAMPPRGPLPDFEFALWTEGDHLVFAAGVNASDRVIATASGAAPDITQNARWKELRENQPFTVTQVAGMDFRVVTSLVESMPLGALGFGGDVTVGELLEVLGLARLQAITVSSGYRGAATWEKINVIAPEPRTGILELLDQRTISLSELPPLPPETDGVFATAFDIRKAVDTVLKTARNTVELVEPQGLREFDDAIEQITQMMGDPREVFSAGLGDVFCIYSDPGMMPFPIGFAPVATASVRDRQALTADSRHAVPDCAVSP